jgi:hypothetical protein
VTRRTLTDEMGLHLRPVPTTPAALDAFLPAGGERSMLMLHALVEAMETGALDRAMRDRCSLPALIAVRNPPRHGNGKRLMFPSLPTVSSSNTHGPCYASLRQPE